MKLRIQTEKGSTLVMTITVVATLLVLLGIAVEYSTQISRNTQRTRKTALAMEIADGHLEALYTNWRNILRTTVVNYGMNTGGTDFSVLPTNHFYTSAWNSGPAPTSYVGGPVPPQIPAPDPSNFSSEANYQLMQYRIQAVDPMISLDASENALYESGTKGGGTLVSLPKDTLPPGAYGPSLGPFGYYYPYSYYYLAAVDVKIPAVNGDVTAKVRRVFEKKFDLPWTYAIFFVDDLEIEPNSSFVVNGPVHTNNSLYITTSNFSVASPTYAAPTPFPTSGRVEYGTDYLNGYHPKDSRYPCTNCTTPGFAKSDSSLTLSDCPPSQVAPYLPFGWYLGLNGGGSGSANDDSYHEIIEPPANYPIPPASAADPIASVRYYNQASIKVLIDSKNNVKVYRSYWNPTDANNVKNSVDPSKIVECTASMSNDPCVNIYKLFVGGGYPSGSSTPALTTNLALQDAREGVNVRISEVDVSKITSAVNANAFGGTLGGVNYNSFFNGVIYIADTTPPRDMGGNRVVIPGTGPIQVPDTNTPAANPQPISFNGNGAPQARLGSTNGTSGGSLVSTYERAIRLVNGYAMPTTGVTSTAGTVGGGLTFVSLNPVYIKGNYNTGTTNANPPSSTTVTNSPSNAGYTRQPAAVICDAINVLSGNWTDANSTQSISGGGYNVTSPRAATHTTINVALGSGIVPTTSTAYSGGAEGFIRLQEDWRTQNFVYYGSVSQFFTSLQGYAPGNATGNFYKAPASTRWFYDYQVFADAPPPGNMQIAAYLQQQRWYQVY
jgi:hypothetical protein